MGLDASPRHQKYNNYNSDMKSGARSAMTQSMPCVRARSSPTLSWHVETMLAVECKELLLLSLGRNTQREISSSHAYSQNNLIRTWLLLAAAAAVLTVLLGAASCVLVLGVATANLLISLRVALSLGAWSAVCL